MPDLSVLMISTEFVPRIIGGLGTVVTNLSKHLARQTCQVTIVTLSARKDAKKISIQTLNGIKIIRFPRKKPYYSNKFQSQIVLRVLRNIISKPDLVHVHSVQGSKLANHLKEIYRCPIIYSCHSLVLKEPGNSKAKRLLGKQQAVLINNADIVTVPSQWQKNILTSYFPGATAKTIIIHNGITYQTRSPSLKYKKNILFAGRLVRSKGIEILLRALPKVLAHHPQTKLYIAGNGTAFYTRNLKQIVTKLKLSRKVFFLNWQSRSSLNQLYRKSRLVVVPSFTESFGLVPLEAISNGTPVIASNVGGLAEVLNNEIATLVPPGRIDLLSQAIIKHFKNPQLSMELVKNGQQQLRKYAWPSVSAKMAGLYKDVLQGKKSY